LSLCANFMPPLVDDVDVDEASGKVFLLFAEFHSVDSTLGFSWGGGGGKTVFGRG